jgi:DNA-binding NarL/FixJ family response regulator
MQVSLSGQHLLDYPTSASTQSTQGVTSQESAETSTQRGGEASDQDDTVKFSLHAQIKNRKEEGMNVAQIAHDLGLDPKTVNTHLYGEASGTTKSA